MVHKFSNKRLKELYPDLKFISHFIRNTSDLKMRTLFLICVSGTENGDGVRIIKGSWKWLDIMIIWGWNNWGKDFKLK